MREPTYHPIAMGLCQVDAGRLLGELLETGMCARKILPVKTNRRDVRASHR
jgi:hypothetical protein